MTPYQNISCGFYDYLVLLLTRKQAVEIQYLEEGNSIEIKAKIQDIYSRKGAEYLRTDTGLEIRLDKLLKAHEQRSDEQKHCQI